MKSMIRFARLGIGVAMLVATHAVHATTVDFDSFAKGTIIKTQLSASGLSITAKNYSNGPQAPVIFDSAARNTPDPDLEGPGWSTGNLPSSTDIGKFIIFDESGVDANKDGRIDNPNDNGHQPGGYFDFTFSKPISSFGFDLVDLDGPKEIRDDGGFVAFFNGKTELKHISFNELIHQGSIFFDPTIKLADHSLNRVSPFTSGELGIPAFDHVRISLGGSGGVDRITFNDVPEPASVAMAALAGATLLLRRRRKA